MSAEANIKASFVARGYGVIATLEPQPIGGFIPGLNVNDIDEWNQPFVVIRQTDRADYDEQCKLAGSGTELNQAYRYFYRVMTD